MKHRSRDSAQISGKIIPRYEARLRKHILQVPPVIRECSGIVIFGRRIKSVAFTTDLCIVRNMDADAVLAVYPFTPQPVIIQALLLAADIPVFAGVGGGLTQGKRVCTLAGYAELQGAAGVVMNALPATMCSGRYRIWSTSPPSSPSSTTGRIFAPGQRRARTFSMWRRESIRRSWCAKSAGSFLNSR